MVMGENSRVRKYLLEFLKCYRASPELWNKKCEDFTDRAKKNAAYNRLLKKYREIYPSADIKSMQKKINQLRGNYMREVKRLNALNKNANGADYVHSSNLWFFDAMSFINDRRTPNSSTNSLNATMPPKKKPRLTACDEIVQVPTVPVKPIGPEVDINSEAAIWIVKLKKMDPTQALIAGKLITDIIFQGQLGQLNLGTSIRSARLSYHELQQLPNATFAPVESQPLPTSTNRSMSAYEVSSASAASTPSPSPRRRRLGTISSEMELPAAMVVLSNCHNMKTEV